MAQKNCYYASHEKACLLNTPPQVQSLGLIHRKAVSLAKILHNPPEPLRPPSLSVLCRNAILETCHEPPKQMKFKRVHGFKNKTWKNCTYYFDVRPNYFDNRKRNENRLLTLQTYLPKYLVKELIIQRGYIHEFIFDQFDYIHGALRYIPGLFDKYNYEEILHMATFLHSSVYLDTPDFDCGNYKKLILEYKQNIGDPNSLSVRLVKTARVNNQRTILIQFSPERSQEWYKHMKCMFYAYPSYTVRGTDLREQGDIYLENFVRTMQKSIRQSNLKKYGREI